MVDPELIPVTLGISHAYTQYTKNLMETKTSLRQKNCSVRKSNVANIIWKKMTSNDLTLMILISMNG